MQKYPPVFGRPTPSIDLLEVFGPPEQEPPQARAQPKKKTQRPNRMARRDSSDKWDTPPSIDVSSFFAGADATEPESSTLNK